MRALTLIRPWEIPVVHGWKQIENRKWRPFRSIIGKLIAVHAGVTYDHDAAMTILKVMRETVCSSATDAAQKESRASCIVGVVRVTNVLTESDSPWFTGPFGWVLEDAQALKEPIPCSGMLGLWKVPPHIEARIAEQLPNLQEVSL